MTVSARMFEAFASRPRPQAAEVLRPTVGAEGDRLKELLSSTKTEELSAQDIRAEVEGNLWMLSPAAFRYFLPAFMRAALDSYSSVSVFVSELVGALTEPTRTDVEEGIERLAPALGDAADVLRKQQLEWFDSGTPAAIFHERFDALTPVEGAAVLEFLTALRQAHGEDFPFDELETATERYWSRYAAS